MEWYTNIFPKRLVLFIEYFRSICDTIFRNISFEIEIENDLAEISNNSLIIQNNVLAGFDQEGELIPTWNDETFQNDEWEENSLRVHADKHIREFIPDYTYNLENEEECKELELVYNKVVSNVLRQCLEKMHLFRLDGARWTFENKGIVLVIQSRCKYGHSLQPEVMPFGYGIIYFPFLFLFFIFFLFSLFSFLFFYLFISIWVTIIKA